MGIIASQNPFECNSAVPARFIGEFASLAALEAAHPTAAAGSYAVVNQSGDDLIYYYSVSDSAWFTQAGGTGSSQNIDETLANGSVTDRTMTLKNTANDKRKLVFNPNTVNGPAMEIYEDVDGVSTCLGSFTAYSFSMLYQALGGADLSWDPYSGLGVTDGTSTIAISQYGITANGELYEWPTSAGGGKLASETFVNALLEGIKSKEPVRVATTANITLSGTQTIDGVALSVGDRILVKNQTTQSQNGIYIVAGGAWQRSLDANTDTELTNALVPVTEGTVNANTTYRQQTTSIVLGTSNIVFQTYGTLVPDADSSTKGTIVAATQYSLPPLARFFTSPCQTLPARMEDHISPKNSAL
jgi:hypothetical protein